MDFQSFLYASPRTLTISTTYQCTAACKNCCVRCTPDVKQLLDFSSLKSIIDEVLHSFDSVEVVVFTGGESFLLGDSLVDAVKYVKERGLVSRVVTNAYWAVSYDKAVSTLRPLVEAGLTEINYSTGDDHQFFVPLQNIVNATLAADDLNLETIVINIESHPNAFFTSSNFRQIESMQRLILNKKVMVIQGAWLSMTDSKSAVPPLFDSRESRPCTNIFQGVVVNPYFEVLACCGLTAEYNGFLKIGRLGDKPLREIWEKQFFDFFKIWVSVDGPRVIYEKLCKKKGIQPLYFNHECGYCYQIGKMEDVEHYLRDLYEEEKDRVMLHYQLQNKHLKIK